jgi:hypothetical protein|tara:strand:- start:30 stop:407 length:378 start_codon:yes stop_codon:yes gene_type:complete
MAHFAKLGVGNKILQVIKVSDNDAPTEQAGVEFLHKLYGTNDVWKQTSYNTYGGEHKLGGTPLRKNFASIGYKYDQYKDAFIPPQPYGSWTLNETSCLWEAPVEYPTDGQNYEWNEDNQTWDLLE